MFIAFKVDHTMPTSIFDLQNSIDQQYRVCCVEMRNRDDNILICPVHGSMKMMEKPSLIFFSSLIDSPLRPMLDTKINLCFYLRQDAALQSSFTQAHVLMADHQENGSFLKAGSGKTRCKGCDGVPCPDRTEGGNSVKSIYYCVCRPQQYLCWPCFLWHIMTPEAKAHVNERIAEVHIVVRSHLFQWTCHFSFAGSENFREAINWNTDASISREHANQ